MKSKRKVRSKSNSNVESKRGSKPSSGTPSPSTHTTSKPTQNQAQTRPTKPPPERRARGKSSTDHHRTRTNDCNCQTGKPLGGGPRRPRLARDKGARRTDRQNQQRESDRPPTEPTTKPADTKHKPGPEGAKVPTETEDTNSTNPKRAEVLGEGGYQTEPERQSSIGLQLPRRHE